MNWQPISSAPRDGTPVYVRNEEHPTWGSHLLYWDQESRRWMGVGFAIFGPIKKWWDQDLDQPTHWTPAGANNE
jgi:hypothetical protein